MSYILDALRKAEKDRNLGRPPSLGDVTSTTARAPAAHGPSRRVLALIALVLGMLVMAMLLWPSAPQVAAPPAVPAIAPAPVPAPVAATPEPTTDTTIAMQPLPDERTVDPTVGADVAAESIDDLMDDQARALSAEEPELPLEEDVPAAPAAAPSRAKAAPAPAAPAVVESAPAAVVDTPAPEPEAAAAVDDVPLLRDMPSDYRGAFPELSVDVHVYHEEPARRWALINGKKAVEGSTLAEGPTISEIRPDGIVFDFRGRPTLFPLGR